MQEKLYYILLFLFTIAKISIAQIEVTTVIPEINASGGMTIDQEGNLYVSDFGPGNAIDSNTVIYKIEKNTFSASVFADGFIGASGACFDSRGNLYQSNNNGNRVSKISSDGTVELDWSTEGFNLPIGIIADSEDNLFVCNCGGNSISKIISDGTSSTFVESELFNCPNGLTIDPDNNLYACNFSDGKVLKITPEGEVSELAELQTLSGGPSQVGNGHITYSNGYLIINLIGIGQVQRICLDGEAEVVAGRPFGFSNEDGSAESATFSKPNGIITSITGDTVFVNTSTPSWVTQPSELYPNQVRMITGLNNLPDDFCEDQPPASNTLFSEITEGVIFETLTFSVGSAWGDYDNDGDQDLFVTDGLNSFGNRLYQNNGDLTFTPINNATTQDGASSFAAIWGDYDNDGNLDLYVSNNSTPPVAPQPNLLYRNEGAPNYTFTKMTNEAPVLYSNYTWSSSWVDYDNDGDLDLHVPENRHRGFDFFFENSGTPDAEGHYFSKTKPAFVTDVVESTGVVSWMDYDNDGDQDLFMIKSGRSHPTGNEDNRIFHNQLSETGMLNFQRVTSAEMVNHLDRDFQASWGDYDNDGDMDVYLGNFDGVSYLYRNEGDSLFTRIQEGAVVEDNTATLGSSWGDYDNDGDLDLFTTNNLGQNANYYENDGNGNFTKLDATKVGAPLLNRSNTQSCSNADINNDGYLDLFVANAPTSATQLSRDFLYLNGGGDRNYLLLTLQGTTSNAAAIGTKVRIKTTTEEESTWQMRVISGNPTGDRAQNSLRVHFGLDESTSIDSMIVEWTSGQQDIFTNVKASQICQITEGGVTTCELLTKTQNQFADLIHFEVHPNPVSGDSLFIDYQLENTKKVRFLLQDINGKLIQSYKQNNIGQFQMNIQNLDAGVYILTLQTKKGQASKKFLVK